MSLRSVFGFLEHGEGYWGSIQIRLDASASEIPQQGKPVTLDTGVGPVTQRPLLAQCSLYLLKRKHSAR